MKLLFCPECWDVQKIVKEEERVCQCGKTRGRALNSNDVEVNGDSIVLGLDNFTLMDVWDKYKTYSETLGLDYNIRCWMFKRSYHKIKRLEGESDVS